MIMKSKKSKNATISSLRCVCVCEVAVNSKGVKTTEKSKSVPDTYLVVTNDDSVIGKIYENHLHLTQFSFLKWGSSFRWSFGPNSAWGSLEMTAIGPRHSTLYSVKVIFVNQEKVRYLLLYVEEKKTHSVDSFYSFIRQYGYLLTVFLFLFSMIFVALPKKSFRSKFSFG